MPSAYDRAIPKGAISYGGGTATSAAARADSGLAGRSSVTVYNEDTVVTLRLGPDASVSSTVGNAKCGIPIQPGASVTVYWSEKVPVYLVALSSISYSILEEG